MQYPISIPAPREGSISALKITNISIRNFNPCSPRGEHLPNSAKQNYFILISIHAPREGSIAGKPAGPHIKRRFQSMLPARGASLPTFSHTVRTKISIHAPREGSILQRAWQKRPLQIYFNPCSPRGEHHYGRLDVDLYDLFQSMLPARGASLNFVYGLIQMQHFNPCSPRGEHRCHAAWTVRFGSFQSMLPARGASTQKQKKSNYGQFQSMLPARGASFFTFSYIFSSKHFNPCSPRGEHLI